MTLNEELKILQEKNGKDYVDPFNDSIQKKGELIYPRSGELAPMFELMNENGEPVKLEDLLKQGPVILSFFKGDFCQLCDLELKTLQRSLPQFKKHGGIKKAEAPTGGGAPPAAPAAPAAKAK